MMSESHPTTTEEHDDLPLELSGQSLELEDMNMKHFDWGEGNNTTAEDKVFIDGGGIDSSQQQQHQPASAAVDKWGPLPYQNGYVFGGQNNYYMEGIRSWSSGVVGGVGGWGSSFGNASQQQPQQHVVTATPVIAAPPLPMAEDDPPPGMIRSSSASETSDETMSAGSSDDDETGSTASRTSASKGVTFNEQVRVLPIPPISSYTPDQRFRMYANRFELRENKVRNKREYEFDNYDWRNATEEHSMAICPLSGELLHPAHL